MNDLARIKELEEGNAELVEFAREDHDKLQARINKAKKFLKRALEALEGK